MILVLDNHDSFVYNVARYIREILDAGVPPLPEAGAVEVRVVRSDVLGVDGVRRLAPSHLVVSPGPCTPERAGVSVQAIQALSDHVPVLGICLGHQALAVAFGARVVRARRPLHGHATSIFHHGGDLLDGLPRPFQAGRYHSLVVDEGSLPPELEVTARSREGEIMALRHRTRPAWGVQFHPESVLTPEGHAILRNFLVLTTRPTPVGLS